MNPIIPAIMPRTYHDIQDSVPRVVGNVDTIQIDLMDGDFVPGRTWPFSHTGAEGLDLQQCRDIIWIQLQQDEIGLPEWEELDYELDLMVRGADAYIDQWIALGPKRIIFHLEALDDPQAFLQSIQDVRTLVEIGLAVGNDTPLETLYPHLEMVDCVQLMGIARRGYQGEPFDERVLDRIRELKAHAPGVVIQIDGSVHAGTIQDLHDAGAERFVAGSAIWGAGDAGDAARELHGLVS